MLGQHSPTSVRVDSDASLVLACRGALERHSFRSDGVYIDLAVLECVCDGKLDTSLVVFVNPDGRLRLHVSFEVPGRGDRFWFD